MSVAAKILQNQFKSAHDWLSGTIGEANNEQLHWQPEGLPSPIGAQYLHVLLVEDFFVSTLSGQQPLMMTDFAGKVGASEMPPMGGPWNEWGKNSTFDLAVAQAYSQAVFARTDDYVGSLSDDDLLEEVDLSAAGAGTQTRAAALSLLLLNSFSHTGEVSALKGLQGEKGYPF